MKKSILGYFTFYLLSIATAAVAIGQVAPQDETAFESSAATPNLRRRAVNPDYHAPIPEANRVGVNSEDDFDGVVRPVSDFVTDAVSKGAGWVRYWIHWDLTAPHKPIDENDYRWSIIDKELLNIRRSGMNIYLDISWAPAWATEGVPGYVTWHCMGYTAGFAKVWFLKDNPDCQQQKPDTVEWMNFVRTVVKRYSQPPYNVKYYGMWNEPNDDIFWHYHDDNFPKVIDEGWPRSPNLTVVKEIFVPGAQAIREANPTAKVVGPEGADVLFLKWVLQEELKHGQIFDVISFHDYGLKYNYETGARQSDSADAVRQMGPIDQTEWYGKVIRDYGRGRPAWITEGWQGDDDPAIYWQAIQDRPWIDKTFMYHDLKTWTTAYPQGWK